MTSSSWGHFTDLFVTGRFNDLVFRLVDFDTGSFIASGLLNRDAFNGLDDPRFLLASSRWQHRWLDRLTRY